MWALQSSAASRHAAARSVRGRYSNAVDCLVLPPSLPSPPIAPWRGSLPAGVLGGVRSNPAIRSCADAATAASRPLIRREQRGKGQALAVWPEGWEQDGMRTRPQVPKRNSSLTSSSPVSLSGSRAGRVGGCRLVLALCRDSPADPPTYHPGLVPGLRAPWATLGRTPACQSISRGGGPFISPVLVRGPRAPHLFLARGQSRSTRLTFLLLLGRVVAGLGEGWKKGACPIRPPNCFFCKNGAVGERVFAGAVV